MPSKHRGKRIATRARILYLGIPVLVVLLLLLIGNYIINEMANDFTKQMARQYAIEASSDFFISTVSHFSTAQNLARSNTIAQWLANEDNEEYRAQAVDEIMGHAEFAEYLSLMFTANETYNVYSLPDGFTAEDVVPGGRMAGLPHSQWYYDVRDAEMPFTFNITRTGPPVGEYHIYAVVHHRVYYQGRFVGVVTAGTPFRPIFYDVFGGFDINYRRGYIIDSEGMVRVDSAELLPLFEDGWARPAVMPEAIDNPNLANAIDAHLQTKTDGMFRSVGVMNESVFIRGNFQYAAIAPIVGMDWSVVVLLSRAGVTVTNFLFTLIFGFAAVVLFVAGGSMLMRRGVLVPLFKLTESVTSVGVVEGKELFGLKREDEIGDLARSIDHSHRILMHREQLLNAVNKTAALLLVSPSEEDSMEAIANVMEIVGRSVEADRVLLWKNETIDGELSFVMKNRWIRNENEQDRELYIGKSFPYSNSPGWFETFSKGEIINAPISELPPAQADFLGGYGVKSIIIIPLFLDGKFFGRLSVGDCHRERLFTDLETDIIRSAGMMFVNAYHLIEKTAEINAAIEKAEEANRAKTQFLSNVSHEIRTPLTAVLGTTESQLQKDRLPADVEEAFLRIQNSSRLLLTIINDLLDLSKVEAGKMVIYNDVYETASMIADTLQLNLVYIGSKEIEFKLEADERLPAFMLGDELRIKQILNNLLSNAFKYTDAGNITLSIVMEGEGKPKEGAHFAETITLVIRVQDTGQGMTQGQIDRLFGIFERFNLHKNRAIEGSGLGMPITYELVKLMNGSIDVVSEPGKGSVFTVRIPQRPHGSDTLGKETAENFRNLEYNHKTFNKIEREPMPYGRVLVVDDVESNLYVAKGCLMPYKLTVETVDSGLLAIQRIKSGQIYDIIFMDHMMPGLDGIDTIKIIRNMGYIYPIVALTANAITGMSEMFIKNGFSDYISKPIDLQQLDKVLLHYIRDKQSAETIKNARKARASSNDAAEGDTDRLPDRLIRAFLSDANTAIGILEPLIEKDALTESELETFTMGAHAIKGALYSINRYAMYETAGALETAGRTADISVIKSKSTLFLSELKQIVAGLQSRKAANEAGLMKGGNSQ